MHALAMLLLLGAAPQDTVTLNVGDALARAVDASPVLEASRSRMDAAAERAGQARAWPNPTLAVTAENVGQAREFTGIDGIRGIEGQAVLRLPLPFGPQRSGARAIADADRAAAAATSELIALDVRMEILQAIGRHATSTALLESARSELESMNAFADALALQASLGRTSRGNAARAELARGLAATREARRLKALAYDQAELTRLLDYPPGTALTISIESCSASATPRFEEVAGPPELWMAATRVDAARGEIQLAQGYRMPDLQPEVGIRRTGGVSGLYLGLSTELPLFDWSSRRIAAAEAEEQAALAEQRTLVARWDAAHSAARSVLEALDAVGARFDGDWFESLEQTVTAAQARFDAGEGTLTELLDSRRARLEAVDDYYTWLSEWWTARIDLARAEGRPPAAALLCTDPFRETP